MLHISITNVEDWEEKAKTLPLWSKSEAGGGHMHPRVFTLGVMLMQLDAGTSIHDDTIAEILTRITMYERLFGPLYTDGDGTPQPVTMEVLQEWKGLAINGNHPKPAGPWLQRAYESMASDLGVTLPKSAVEQHLKEVCEDAGFPMMVGVYDILRDRGAISEDTLLGLDDDAVAEQYWDMVGPAVDRIERSLKAQARASRTP